MLHLTLRVCLTAVAPFKVLYTGDAVLMHMEYTMAFADAAATCEALGNGIKLASITDMKQHQVRSWLQSTSLALYG